MPCQIVSVFVNASQGGHYHLRQLHIAGWLTHRVWYGVDTASQRLTSDHSRIRLTPHYTVGIPTLYMYMYVYVPCIVLCMYMCTYMNASLCIEFHVYFQFWTHQGISGNSFLEKKIKFMMHTLNASLEICFILKCVHKVRWSFFSGLCSPFKSRVL